MSKSILQIATKQDIAAFSSDIKSVTATVRKWMFILWLGQIGTTVAAIILIAKK